MVLRAITRYKAIRIQDTLGPDTWALDDVVDLAIDQLYERLEASKAKVEKRGLT